MSFSADVLSVLNTVPVQRFLDLDSLVSTLFKIGTIWPFIEINISISCRDQTLFFDMTEITRRVLGNKPNVISRPYRQYQWVINRDSWSALKNSLFYDFRSSHIDYDLITYPCWFSTRSFEVFWGHKLGRRWDQMKNKVIQLDGTLEPDMKLSSFTSVKLGRPNIILDFKVQMANPKTKTGSLNQIRLSQSVKSVNFNHASTEINNDVLATVQG